jgi:threonine synthase
VTTFTHLECGRCGRRYEAGSRQGRCTCGGALLARYDLELARASWSRDWVRNGPVNLWRYAPVLPVRQADSIVSLGEGMTPLLLIPRLASEVGARRLWIKQEGAGPTGSWKARRLALSVSMARELHFDTVAVASSGNAAVALATYAAAAGMRARVYLPSFAEPWARAECAIYGAQVLADDAAPDQSGNAEAWRDLGPWRDPYGLEGAKTLGYELAEQFNWEPPDAILCPCGSGVGLVALWKAFTELRELGWTAGRFPRLVGVTIEGAGSAVDGFGPPSLALFPELALGQPENEELVRRALEDTGGARIAVGTAELAETALRLASREGILPSLEGAACVQAVACAAEQGILKPEDRVVVVNPAAGSRRLDLYMRLPRVSESRQAARQGGLITPR